MASYTCCLKSWSIPKRCPNSCAIVYKNRKIFYSSNMISFAYYITLYWISSYYILPLLLGLFCCVFFCNLLVEGENNCYTQTGRTPCSRLFYFHYRNHKPYPLMIAPLHLEKLQIQMHRSFLLFLPSLLARMGCGDENFHYSGYIYKYWKNLKAVSNYFVK